MPTKSFLLAHEPHWIAARQGIHQHLPDSAQSWIYEPGSITQRLRSYYGDGVKVEILFLEWQAPFLSESRMLRVPTHRYALTREVLLHINGKPLILARTLIPERTLRAARRNLAHLGNRPLGEVIFSYPKLQRLEMDFTEAEPSVWTEAAIGTAHIGQSVWGRRTIYSIRHRQMLINEFFMPDALLLP
ncbi:chorismate lyase [Methylicorpusculum oleiharenae]|uniref:chorismate--pyruvate lyase family protein n=1 Tax=Methylicorpusculum oleiharenae TaxID=1338687 RepID=UPI001356E889|nr:chorismate lyase [Methylicorpusculum oleiharenae]MCD2449172.1 chorismate lyase [Methylicorpusculum oleiharenae]